MTITQELSKELIYKRTMKLSQMLNQKTQTFIVLAGNFLAPASLSVMKGFMHNPWRYRILRVNKAPGARYL